MNKKPYILTASLVCANMLELKEDIKCLEEGGIDWIHFDVMDGQFVPRLGLHPEILQHVKSVTNLPVDVHLMINNPENFLDLFAKSGADVITVHAESTPHLHRVVKLIKNLGKKVGIALNPATPLSVLDYILDDIDLVCLMAINPGILGHKLIPQTMQKIRDLKLKLKDFPHIHVEIDGGVTFESAPEMLKAGADVLVCGSSTIFKSSERVDKKVKELKRVLDLIIIN